MTDDVLEPRYKAITPEIICSAKLEQYKLTQQELIFCQEIANMDDVVELKGGRINVVYKGSMDGIKRR